MTKNTEKKMTTIQDLIDLGKKQGKLTSADIDKFLEGVSFDVEQVDKLYETLETNNIDVIDIIEEEADSNTKKAVGSVLLLIPNSSLRCPSIRISNAASPRRDDIHKSTRNKRATHIYTHVDAIVAAPTY